MSTIITDTQGQQYVGVLDTSGWQARYTGNGRIHPDARGFNMKHAVDRGIVGVFHRIGNGRTFDQSYPLMRQSCLENKLHFGPYYYFQPNSISAVQAAQLCIEWMEKYGRHTLPLMLDCEEYNGNQGSSEAVGAYIRHFLEEIEGDTGSRPIIYSGAWWWNRNVSGDFTNYDTMQARYPRWGTRPPSDITQWDKWIPWSRGPLASGGLGDWEGWQFSSDAMGPDFGMPIDAATDRLDVNVVKVEAWNHWIGAAKPPSIEPPTPIPAFDPFHAKWSLWPLNPNKPYTQRLDQGDAVAYIQGVIFHKAGGDITIDGDFGRETERRVKDVQRWWNSVVKDTAKKVKVDGEVGRQTWPIIDMLAVFSKPA